jgi:uncharacterized protein (TIGR00369 family)
MQLPDKNSLENRIRTSFSLQTLMQSFGAEVIVVEAGRCVIAAPILPHARQQHGAGHAGLSFALGDVAAGYAALTMMPTDREVMTVEMKINLLSPAVGHQLIATGEVMRAGARLIVVRAEVQVSTKSGLKTVALLQGTMIPVDPPQA